MHTWKIYASASNFEVAMRLSEIHDGKIDHWFDSDFSVLGDFSVFAGSGDLPVDEHIKLSWCRRCSWASSRPCAACNGSGVINEWIELPDADLQRAVDGLRTIIKDLSVGVEK